MSISNCGIEVTKAPNIASVTPIIGPKGTLVKIGGSDFGTDAAKVKVFFNSKEGVVQSVNDDIINAFVPAGAGTGVVKVEANGISVLGPQFTYVISEITVSTVAGSGTQGDLDGSAASAELYRPAGIAQDSKGEFYFVDTFNHKIKKITKEGQVITIAGSTAGDVDGNGSNAMFNLPAGLVFDSDDNMFVTDYSNHKIRKVTPNGDVTTLAGVGTAGDLDGAGSVAKFNHPQGIGMDRNGNLYVADQSNHKIRKVIAASGAVSTFAGTGVAGNSDGNGTVAQFNFPQGIGIDSDGNIFVADQANNKIKKISPTGDVTYFAGRSEGDADGLGSAAMFNRPSSVTVAPDGNIYVTDYKNNKIKKITPSGEVTTLAGNGASGSTDGLGATAQFFHPAGIMVTANNEIYVADRNNHKIRKIVQE